MQVGGALGAEAAALASCWLTGRLSTAAREMHVRVTSEKAAPLAGLQGHARQLVQAVAQAAARAVEAPAQRQQQLPTKLQRRGQLQL